MEYRSPNRSYLGIKDGEKTVYVDFFTDKLQINKRLKMLQCAHSTDAQKSLQIFAHLGHLDHIGELSQAGNGDHIMVGFQFAPGDVIKQLM